MTPVLSLYLDGLRFFAAFMVFLSHYSTADFSGGVFWQIQPYGRTAVLVFFVLSGFVIAWVTENRERRGLDYALSRIARLYSVIIPSFLVTIVLDQIALPGDPKLADSVLGYVASFAFLGWSWTLELYPGANLPYWSLNYEAWYYILFGCFTFCRGGWRVVALIVGALLAGPKILLMLPIWLMGVAAWHGRHLAERFGVVLILVAVLGFGTLAAFGGPDFFSHADTPWLTDKYSIYDYIVGGLVTLLILGLANTSLSLPGPATTRVIRTLAGTSFGLYLLHYPLLRFFADVLPKAPTGPLYRVLLFVLTLGLSLGFAVVIEHRKGALKRVLQAMFGASADATAR